MKKSILILSVILLLLTLGGVRLLSDRKKEYNISVSDITNEDFTKDVYQKNATYISGDKMLSSNGRYICYDDMAKGVETALCTVTDCLHNNGEQCNAIFADDALQEFVTVYKQKLIVGGSSESGLEFYTCDLDGTNHKQIAKAYYEDDMTYRFGTPDKNGKYPVQQLETATFLSFVVDGTNVYIATNVQDTSEIKQMEDGRMTWGLTLGMIYCLNLETHELRKVAETEEPFYANYLRIRYKDGDRIYLEQKGCKTPYEELYDLKTDKIKKDADKEQLVSRGGYLTLSTGKITWQEDYAYSDYIGSRGDERFFVELEGLGKTRATGVVRVEDLHGNRKNTIRIKELKGQQYPENACMYALSEGFVLTVCDNSTNDYLGDVYFYNEDGSLKTKSARSRNAVIDETKDYYLLAGSQISIGPTAYIRKEEIDDMNRNFVELYGGEDE